jgi:hypothetical protein
MHHELLFGIARLAAMVYWLERMKKGRPSDRPYIND